MSREGGRYSSWLEQRDFPVIARVTTESVYIGARGDRLNGLEGGRDREKRSLSLKDLQCR